MEYPIYAPLSGKIVRLTVAPGDRVEEDAEILAIEAMKMETPVYSPCDGKISEIHVGDGDDVAEQELLAAIIA